MRTGDLVKKGSMPDVLHVSTGLFFRLIKHVKNKQLKLLLDFTCNKIFTQQFGTITAITLKNFKRLFLIFYAALWLKWNQKWSILLNVLSESLVHTDETNCYDTALAEFFFSKLRRQRL